MSQEKEAKKRVRYLDTDEKTVKGVVRLPKSLHEKLMEEAKVRELSASSIIREALSLYLERSPDATIPETKIDALLKDCTTEDEFFEDEHGFEIEGDEGFLVQVRKRRLLGKIWEEPQLEKVAGKFIVGYKGYFIKPSIDDLVDRFARAMKLDEKQKAYLKQKVREQLPKEVEKSEEEEEW